MTSRDEWASTDRVKSPIWEIGTTVPKISFATAISGRCVSLTFVANLDYSRASKIVSIFLVEADNMRYRCVHKLLWADAMCSRY